jgi:hypothetical protein
MNALTITTAAETLVFARYGHERTVFKSQLSKFKKNGEKWIMITFHDGHTERIQHTDLPTTTLNGLTFDTIDLLNEALNAQIFGMVDLTPVTGAIIRLDKPSTDLVIFSDEELFPLIFDVTVIDGHGNDHSFTETVIWDNTWVDCSLIYASLVAKLNTFKGVNCEAVNLLNGIGTETGVATNSMQLKTEIAKDVKVVIERNDFLTSENSGDATVVSLEEKDGQFYAGFRSGGSNIGIASTCFYELEFPSSFPRSLTANEWLPNKI